MTMNRSDLNALLLLLLTTSSLVSSRRLLSVDVALQNTTTSKTTQGSEKVDPTKGTPHSLNTTGINQEGSRANSTTAPPASEGLQASTGNGTSAERLYPSNRTETNSSKVQPAGTESSPTHQLPENNGTPATTSGSIAPTLPASVEPEVKTSNRTNTSVTTVTESSSSRSTVQTDVRTSPTQKIPSSTTSTTQKSTAGTHTCPTAEPKKDKLVGRCLISIAVLAALATIFIFTTIVLAMKLAGARQRNRSSLLLDTEMVCISALMNDSNHPLPYTKHPKSNGALIPNTEDDDDDLTLNSFLPDAEGAP